MADTSNFDDFEEIDQGKKRTLPSYSNNGGGSDTCKTISLEIMFYKSLSVETKNTWTMVVVVPAI